MSNCRYSHHARERMVQRACPPELVELVLEFGRHIHGGGNTSIYYLGRAECQRARAAGHYMRDGWQGTGVVLGTGGLVITVVRYDRPPRA